MKEFVYDFQTVNFGELLNYLKGHIELTLEPLPSHILNTRHRGGKIRIASLIKACEDLQSLIFDTELEIETLQEEIARIKVPELEAYIKKKNLDAQFKKDLLGFLAYPTIVLVENAESALTHIEIATSERFKALEVEFEAARGARKSKMEALGYEELIEKGTEEFPFELEYLTDQIIQVKSTLGIKPNYNLDLYLDAVPLILKNNRTGKAFLNIYRGLIKTLSFVYRVLILAYSSRRASASPFYRSITVWTYKTLSVIEAFRARIEDFYENIARSETRLAPATYREYKEELRDPRAFYHEIENLRKQISFVFRFEEELRPVESDASYLTEVQKGHLRTRVQDIPTPTYSRMAYEILSSPKAVKAFLQSEGIDQKRKWSDIPLEQKVTRAMELDIESRYGKDTPEDIAADYAQLSAQEVMQVMVNLGLAETLKDLKRKLRALRNANRDPHWAFRDLNWSGDFYGHSLQRRGIVSDYRLYTLAELADRINRGLYGPRKRNRKMTPARLSDMIFEVTDGEIDPSDFRGIMPINRNNPLEIEEMEFDV